MINSIIAIVASLLAIVLLIVKDYYKNKKDKNDYEKHKDEIAKDIATGDIDNINERADWLRPKPNSNDSIGQGNKDDK